MLTILKTFLHYDKKWAANRSLTICTIGFLALLLVAFHWFHPPDTKLFADDAGSYIAYDPMRTIGYPVFLSVIKLLTGGYEAIPIIQLSLLALSVCAAALSLSFHLRSFFIGLAFVAATLSLREIVQFCFQIMTESLSLSILLLLLVSCIGFAVKQTKQYLFYIGLCVGLSILIRPSAYAFLGPTVLLILCYRHILRQAIIYVGTPLVFCLILGASVNYCLHGFFSTQSFMGHNLYGKVAFSLREGIRSEDPLEQKMLDKMTNVMLPVQAQLQSVESLRLYYVLAAPIYDRLRYPLLFSRFMPELPEAGALKDKDRFYKNVALKVIKQNPIAYAKDVGINLAALWFVWDLKTNAEKDELVKWIDKLKTTQEFKAIDLDYGFYKFRNKPDAFVYLVRSFLYVSFTVSLLFFGVGAWSILVGRRPKNLFWIIGFFCSACIHASYLVTALVQAGLPRYAMVMWPYMFAMLLILSGTILNRINERVSA